MDVPRRNFAILVEPCGGWNTEIEKRDKEFHLFFFDGQSLRIDNESFDLF